MIASYSKTHFGKVMQDRPQSAGPTKPRDLGNAWTNVLFVMQVRTEAQKQTQTGENGMKRCGNFLKAAGSSGLQLSSPLVRRKAGSRRALLKAKEYAAGLSLQCRR